jgi:hypothetical protein
VLDATTTEMTWVAPNLPATDAEYSFLVEIAGARGSRAPFRVAIREAVLEIIATPG